MQNKVLGIKPVATGCDIRDGVLSSEDVRALSKQNPPSNFSINPWKYHLPVSPHLADFKVSAQDIVEFSYQKSFSTLDVLLIETAGGLMAPINDTETWIDFLTLSRLPVIFVVGMRLGCLNHAMLTEQVLRSHGIHCAGWVANCIQPDMLKREENIHTLHSRLKSPWLTTVSYQGTIDTLNKSV